MVLPNFLIIGTAKAGTTSVANFLSQHPEAYIPDRKELNFFTMVDELPEYAAPGDQEEVNEDPITNIDTYKAYFSSASGFKAIGEASTWYLYDSDAAQQIHRFLPEAKLIAILRNPTERAFSSYCHTQLAGRETAANFAEALQQEDFRIKNNWSPIWHYKNMGFYHQQLLKYMEIFEKEKMLILLYEDFATDSQKFMKEIFEFLEIDSTFKPFTSVQYNKTGLHRNKMLNDWISKSNPIKTFAKNVIPTDYWSLVAQKIKNMNIQKPEIQDKTKETLLETYREDILKVQDLIQRDLSRWLH